MRLHKNKLYAKEWGSYCADSIDAGYFLSIKISDEKRRVHSINQVLEIKWNKGDRAVKKLSITKRWGDEEFDFHIEIRWGAKKRPVIIINKSVFDLHLDFDAMTGDTGRYDSLQEKWDYAEIGEFNDDIYKGLLFDDIGNIGSFEFTSDGIVKSMWYDCTDLTELDNRGRVKGDGDWDGRPLKGNYIAAIRDSIAAYNELNKYKTIKNN